MGEGGRTAWFLTLRYGEQWKKVVRPLIHLSDRRYQQLHNTPSKSWGLCIYKHTGCSLQNFRLCNAGCYRISA